MRILLEVAYDGTNYHGWQVQPNVVTIEGQLNKVLSELTGEKIEVIGASRTDAGVHALGNIAVFDTSATIPATAYQKAVNGRLPWDIRITDSFQVAEDFHPRHMDTRKTYCYHICHSDICMPQDRLYNFHVYGPVDVSKMQQAAKFFVGEHDFAGFCAVGSMAETTVRTIYDLNVSTRQGKKPLADIGGRDGKTCIDSEYIDIRVTGSGFLYNMVRIIAGTLLEVGRGRIPVEDIPDIIASCQRQRSGPTLPAMGLVLEKYKLEV